MNNVARHSALVVVQGYYHTIWPADVTRCEVDPCHGVVRIGRERHRRVNVSAYLASGSRNRPPNTAVVFAARWSQVAVNRDQAWSRGLNPRLDLADLTLHRDGGTPTVNGDDPALGCRTHGKNPNQNQCS